MVKFPRSSDGGPASSFPPGWEPQLSPTVRKLFEAIKNCHFKKLKYLLQNYSAKITSRNEFGQPVLIVALHIEEPEPRLKMFKYLLRHGANPLTRDTSFGRNSLLWSCVLQCREEARCVLDGFCGELDIREMDKDGVTALHHAVAVGSMDIVRMLIEVFYKYRLSVDIPDRLGLTPYMQARRLGHYQIAQLLKDQGKASPHRRDILVFRTGTEWSQVGRKEREIERRNRLQEEIAWVKVLGRAPKLKTGFGLPARARGRHLSRLPPLTQEESGDTESGTLSEPIMDGKSTSLSNHSLPEPLTDRRAGSEQNTNKVTHSLMDMTENGRHVKQFHKSQALDSTSDLGSLDNLAAFFDILVDQSSDSYRKSVEKPVIIPEVKSPVKKPKVSSLAIVMGRKRGDKGRKTKLEKRETRSRLAVIDEDRPVSKDRRRGSKLRGGNSERLAQPLPGVEVRDTSLRPAQSAIGVTEINV